MENISHLDILFFLDVFSTRKTLIKFKGIFERIFYSSTNFVEGLFD